MVATRYQDTRCIWIVLVHSQPPWLAMGQEYNERVFSVWIPSILTRSHRPHNPCLTGSFGG